MPRTHQAVPSYRALRADEVLFSADHAQFSTGVHWLAGGVARPMLAIAKRILIVNVHEIPRVCAALQLVQRAVRGLNTFVGHNETELCPDVWMEFRVVRDQGLSQCGITLMSCYTHTECGRVVMSWRELGALARELRTLRRVVLKAVARG